MAPPPAKKQKTGTSMRDLLKNIVTVEVGMDPSHDTFHIHKELACTKSTYFSEVLSESSEQGKKVIVDMPGEDPQIFAIFQNWLYTSKLLYETIVEPETVEGKCELAINIIAFGILMGAEGFHNKGIDLIMEFSSDTLLGGWHIFDAYEKTPEDAPLRLLLQQVTAAKLKTENFNEIFFSSLETCPNDFVREVFKICHGSSQTGLWEPVALPASAFYLGSS